jgi:hypothetical protein
MMMKLQQTKPGNINLFVIHVGLNTPEMSVMEDANPWGPKEMSRNREAEFKALISPQFQQLLRNPKYRIVNYRMLNEEMGISKLKRPAIN